MNNFGNPQYVMNQLRQFRSNPMQFLAQKGLNIPQQYANDPTAAAQYLMNNGQLSQEQYSIASNVANNIQNNGFSNQNGQMNNAAQNGNAFNQNFQNNGFGNQNQGFQNNGMFNR